MFFQLQAAEARVMRATSANACPQARADIDTERLLAGAVLQFGEAKCAGKSNVIAVGSAARRRPQRFIS
jgi:hypothetical protein